MTSLVTGASGFVGSHLVDALLARGERVVALQRKPGADRRHLRIVVGDVSDADFVARVVGEFAPTAIFHLAAQSLPRSSWDEPWPTHQVNVGGTIHLLEAARRLDGSASIVIASSSSVYAQRHDDAPITEDDPCRPASPYGVSKLAADHLGRLYALGHEMRVMLARPFFLIGTRKTGDVCSDWARNIVAIERGRETGLSVGNLDVVRDFLPVGDGVEGLLAIAERGRPGEAYNISSGRGWRLGDVLRHMTDMAKVPIAVRQAEAKLRPLDERAKIGSPAKLEALGWHSRKDVPSSLAEILQYWRQQT